MPTRYRRVVLAHPVGIERYERGICAVVSRKLGQWLFWGDDSARPRRVSQAYNKWCYEEAFNG